METINQFRYKYFFLSNFSRNKVQYKNLSFETSEHAYQWAKCDSEEDKSLIFSCKSPTQVKKFGHSIRCDIKNWDKNKLKIMKEILLCKFLSPTNKKKLLDTGHSFLIEGNFWCDQYWGNCLCKKCKDIPGLNNLGKLLMEVRKEIMENPNL